MKAFFSRNYWILVFIIFFLLLFYPILVPGLYFSHYDMNRTFFIPFEFYEALKQGQFPVEWISTFFHGYGTPYFIFYAALPFYIVAILFHFLQNIFLTYKIYIFTTTILAFFSFYFLSKEFFTKNIAIIASIIYIAFPFHIKEIYNRFNLGAMLSYVFAPLILYSIFQFIKLDKQKYLFLTGLTLALFLLCYDHNDLILALFLPFFLLFLIFAKIVDFKKFIKIGSALFLGVILSSFYILPVITEIKYLNSDIYYKIGIYQDSYKKQFFPNFLVAEYQVSKEELPAFNISKDLVLKSFIVAIIVTLLGLWFLFKNKKSKNKYDRFRPILKFFLVCNLVIIFLVVPLSTFVWEILTPLQILQMPWRFFFLSNLTLPLVIGYLLMVYKNKISLFKVSLVFIFIIIMFFPYLSFSNFYFYPNDSYYFKKEYETSNQLFPDFIPSYVKKLPDFAYTKFNKSEDYDILKQNIITQRYEIEIFAKKSIDLAVNTFYFPGWNAYIDNKKTNIFYNNDFGAIMIKVPQGYHKIFIKFEDTPIRKVSKIISFIAFITLLAGWLIYNLRNAKK